MKVELTKNYQFYLNGNMKKLYKMKKGATVEVDQETADRWIKKEVAKEPVKRGPKAK